MAKKGERTNAGIKRKVWKPVAKKTAASEQKKVVLVGTYRKGQLERWPGYYNYPILPKDKIDLESAKRVNELWLFSGAKDGKYFAAECFGVKTREELKEFGYKATGKGHGSGKYLLFKTKELYAPSTDFAEAVIIRTKDFAGQKNGLQRKLKAYLESPDRKDPILGKMLPKIVLDLPRERLRVCEAVVQLEFVHGIGLDVYAWPKSTDTEGLRNQLEYSIVCINEFARKNGVSRDVACDFLSRYKGLDHLVRFYDVESTMPLEMIVQDLGKVCYTNGGRF